MDNTSHHLPNEMYSSNRQYQMADYKTKGDRNVKEGCRRRNDSSDTKFIYQDSPGRLYKNRYERNQQNTQPPTYDSSQVKWSRNNIAMTMEYFEPISSTSTPKRYSNHSDYSYAYYEPGAVMRHSNIPKMQTTDQPNSPSTRSSPKSIRSLLYKPVDDRAKPKNRHTYTTRYGTQENIYEDVSSIRIQPGLQSSDQCVSAEGPSKIEFQDTLHNHYRVLEELNLSLEELFLSTATKSNVLSPRKPLKRSTKQRTKVKGSDVVSCKNVFASSVNELAVGEDSGFSGSSSGASYVGNLRNYKTALTRSHRNSTEFHNFTNVHDCNASQGSINVRAPDSYRNIPIQMMNQLKGDKRSSSLKGLKFPFWNKR